MLTKPQLRVALCGIGLEAYWEQFDGLRAEIEGSLTRAGEQLQSPGVHLVPLGLIDSAGRAREAGRQCRAANADLLILYVTTYALSSTVLLLTQQARCCSGSASVFSGKSPASLFSNWNFFQRADNIERVRVKRKKYPQMKSKRLQHPDGCRVERSETPRKRASETLPIAPKSAPEGPFSRRK
jgi:hypothetical protein